LKRYARNSGKQKSQAGKLFPILEDDVKLITLDSRQESARDISPVATPMELERSKN